MPKITIRSTKEIEAAYLLVEAGVRYWDDAEINGELDTEDGDRMPFNVLGTWRPLIDLSTGKIEGWPEGTTASVHYKVCDDGVYTLLNAQREEVAKISGYVPEIMCPAGQGYGDYIIMEIGPDGTIKDWDCDLAAFEEAA